MNKAELVDQIAEGSGLSKIDASSALDAFTIAIGNALKAGDKVSLIGFGTFMVKERAARKGRNPRTGEEIMISASKSAGFKAGKSLNDSIK